MIRVNAGIPAEPPADYAAYVLEFGTLESRQNTGQWLVVCISVLALGVLLVVSAVLEEASRVKSNQRLAGERVDPKAQNSSGWWAAWKERFAAGTPQRRYAARQESDAAIREMKEASKADKKSPQ